jgi:Protein of unknown function (DUF2934)
MIAEAAYYRAERRRFVGGDAVRDWCEAEAEIDARLQRIEHAKYAARIEEALETASKKLASVRRKAASVSTSARAEWQKDVDKLAALRDALKPKLVELREEGERAGQKLREQAERIRGEIVDLVRLLEAKAKH